MGEWYTRSVQHRDERNSLTAVFIGAKIQVQYRLLSPTQVISCRVSYYKRGTKILFHLSHVLAKKLSSHK